MDDTGFEKVDEKIRSFGLVEILSKLEHTTVSALLRN
jgi:hypothetical protein